LIISEIESSIIHHIDSTEHTYRGGDFHLSYKTKEMNFQAKMPLAQMEEMLDNEFDLLR